MFSKDSLLIPVAVKAIWLLYVRGRWEQLRQIGIRRAEVEPALTEYADTRTGASFSKRHVYRLLQTHPAILGGAVRMAGVYMILYSEEVKRYVRQQPDDLPQ